MWNSNTDRVALQDGAIDLDAWSGSWLLKNYKARWYREGFDAFLQGAPFESLWNHAQRRGFMDAKAEADAAIEEKDCRPWLDATPWQIPLDVLGSFDVYIVGLAPLAI